MHIDVGPARSWDEKTSGVGTGISDDNKLIGLVTDYDVYAPGMEINLRFIRMTAFPIGVNPVFFLFTNNHQDAEQMVHEFTPSFGAPESPCPRFNDIAQMASIRWTLPVDSKPGRYRIKAHFCDNPWKDMPEQIETPEFEIRK